MTREQMIDAAVRHVLPGWVGLGKEVSVSSQTTEYLAKNFRHDISFAYWQLMLADSAVDLACL